MNIQSIKAKIIPILESGDVVKAAVFGSHATGEAGKDSDVDLLTYGSIHPLWCCKACVEKCERDFPDGLIEFFECEGKCAE